MYTNLYFAKEMHQIGGAENSPEEDANAWTLASPNHCQVKSPLFM